jgi:hypothetical protein
MMFGGRLCLAFAAFAYVIFAVPASRASAAATQTFIGRDSELI